MSLPLCQILAFQPAWYLLYLVNLVKKRQLVNILFNLEIHTYHGSLKASTGNSWPFPQLLPC